MRHPLARLVPVGVLAGLLVPLSARAGQPRPTSLEATAGPYEVTLKVLPAEHFEGPRAEMAWDGGARPLTLTDGHRPNRHLVAFVKRGGKPVVDAKVAIRYRLTGMHRSRWMRLPVARMHVAGKSKATTHYGNNVRLRPGWYEAQVTVNGHTTRALRFVVSGPSEATPTAPKTAKPPTGAAPAR